MSQELHYTSVPRGLLPGTRGFCTVACTPNMSGPLRERLESLSGYQQVFPPHDPKVGLNPVVFSHHRLNLGGRSYSVLSRVSFAGLDYTSRSNKYAHHVVLDPAERPPGGPAWLLSQPGFMEPIWQGEPRFIAAGRTPPQGDHPAGIAHAWQSLTGDAGWAGTLAESFITDQQRPAVLIFEPGMNLLPLLVEASALLPVPRRWDVEFSTYFTQLPHGLTCAWRGVLAGTEPARQSPPSPNVLILELDGSMREAPDGPLVQLARRGYRPEDIGKAIEEVRRRQGSQQASRAGAGRAVDQSHSAGAHAQDQLSSQTPAYEVIPKLGSVTCQPPLPLAVFAPQARRGDARRSRYLATIVTSLFVLISVSLVFAVYGTRLRSILGPSKAHSLIEESRAVVAAAKSESKGTEPESVATKESPPGPMKEMAVQEKKAERPSPTGPGEIGGVQGKPLAGSISVRTGDSIKPKPPVQRALKNKVEIVWYKLEEPPSGLGRPIKQPPLEFHPELVEIQSIDLLGSSASLTGVFSPSDGLKIRQTGREGKAGEVAQFEVSPSQLLTFHWYEGAMSLSQRATREDLRDCALKVRRKEGATYFVVLRQRVEDYEQPMGLGPEPMNWDVGDVFTQSKRPLFIDRVMATTQMHPTGTKVEKSKDSREWIVRHGSEGEELVSIRLDAKDGKIHVQPKFDPRLLLERNITRDIGKLVQRHAQLERNREIARGELTFKNLTNEQARYLEGSLGDLDRELSQLARQKDRLELIRDLRTMKVNMVLSTEIAGVKIDVKKIGNFPDQAHTLTDE